MKARPRSRTQLTFHPIVIASALVFIVLFLALGYHTGISQGERVFRERLQEVHQQKANQTSILDQCRDRTRTLMKKVARSNTQVHDLGIAVDELRKKQDEVQATYKGLDVENHRCDMNRTEAKQRLEAGETKDRQTRQEVDDLKKDVDALQASIQDITHGEGMSVVLLDEVVKSLRTHYEHRCRFTPGCVELTDEDLLKIEVTGNRTEEEITQFLNRDAVAQRKLERTQLGPQGNASGIYLLPTVDEEALHDPKRRSPTYFNRSIVEKPLRGVGNNDSLPHQLGTVTKLLKSYGDYAMCAYRHNNAKFSFQSAFLYAPNDPKILLEQAPVLASLHELFVSPLLQYCIQCDAKIWTREYTLACFNDRMWTVKNYGSRDFWVVRSMIQAAPAVQQEALQYYEARELEKKRVLAVVLHASTERDLRRCDRQTVIQYDVHYQYLEANFPNDTALKTHVSEDHYAQCAPTPAQIIAHVQRVRQAAGGPYDAIYLSTSPDVRSNVLALLAQQKDGAEDGLKDLLLPAYTNPAKEKATPGFTELADLEIASRATDILVSPFLLPSRYVTETFLLRHELSPGGHIWMF